MSIIITISLLWVMCSFVIWSALHLIGAFFTITRSNKYFIAIALGPIGVILTIGFVLWDLFNKEAA